MEVVERARKADHSTLIEHSCDAAIVIDALSSHQPKPGKAITRKRRGVEYEARRAGETVPFQIIGNRVDLKASRYACAESID